MDMGVCTCVSLSTKSPVDSCLCVCLCVMEALLEVLLEVRPECVRLCTRKIIGMGVCLSSSLPPLTAICVCMYMYANIAE